MFLFSPAFADEMVDRLKADVEVLCSPEFAGRGIPEYGGMHTAVWLAQQFSDIGLYPAFGDTSYFQRFEVITALLDTQKTKLNMISLNDTLTLSWGIDFFYFPNNIIPTDTIFKATMCNYGLVIENQNRNDFERINKRDLAVVFSGADEDGAKSAGRGVMTPFKSATAKRLGASGLAVLHSDWPPLEIKDKYEKIRKLIVDLPNSGFSFPTLHIKEKYLPNIQLSTNVELTIRFSNITTESVFNVAAKIPGKQNDFVVVGAHYDHEGETTNGGYFPGADDNASGIASLLEICRRWKDRNITNAGLLAIGFTAEEHGLLGSKFFTSSLNDNPLSGFQKQNIKAMINLDMIGRQGFANMRDAQIPGAIPNPDYAAAYFSASAPELRDIIRGARDLGDISLDIMEVNQLRFSDAGTFNDAQIPAIHIFSGFHADYSRLSDTPDKIDYSKLARMTLLIDRLLINISEYPKTIDFNPSIHSVGSKMPY